MKVVKFGGTSVGTIESFRMVRDIVVSDPTPTFVVLSAVSGITNELLVVLDAIENHDTVRLDHQLNMIRQKHVQLIDGILSDVDLKQQTLVYLDDILVELRGQSAEAVNLYSLVITRGEMLSTFIFSKFLEQDGYRNQKIDATEFMKVANTDNPDIQPIRDALHSAMDKAFPIYITQGFLCLDATDAISNLERGGSDYTATIIGAALQAKEVQIWTDIDGFHNNDPRHVTGTTPIAQLTYEEAAELAYFGAKILHPKTVSPVRKLEIPIYLKNTFEPESIGTKISATTAEKGLKAIAAKDGIIAINIKSNQMLMAYGFLRKVFEVFEKFQTPIDMITTSEIAVSLTIDEDKNLNAIVKEIEIYGTITVHKQQTIVSIVGDSLITSDKASVIFEIVKEVPVRMVSYGGSINNISLLIATEDKLKALQGLHALLFAETKVVSA